MRREYRAMTVQYRPSGRWFAWLSERDTSTYTADCCDRGHSSLPAAARHGAKRLAAEAVNVWMEAAKDPDTWAHAAIVGEET